VGHKNKKKNETQEKGEKTIAKQKKTSQKTKRHGGKCRDVTPKMEGGELRRSWAKKKKTLSK